MREKKPLNIQIGNEIRIARERAGLTQQQFGEMVSLDSKNISDIERGVVGISTSRLKQISEKLLVSPDIILFGNQNKNDVEYLTEQLKRLPPKQFAIVRELMNRVFKAFILLNDSH